LINKSKKEMREAADSDLERGLPTSAHDSESGYRELMETGLDYSGDPRLTQDSYKESFGSWLGHRIRERFLSLGRLEIRGKRLSKYFS